MKKLLALACVVLSVATGASATTYTDTNPADVRLDATAGTWFGPFWVPNALYNPSYTGAFTLAGYNPATDIISSASVSFNLWDAGYIGPINTGGSESYLVTLTDLSFSGNSFAGAISFGDNLTGLALFDLSQDGILSYTVTATSGSFWLYEASLTATWDTAPTSVPDTGATLGLMGAALLGLVAVRRKIRA